MGTGGIGGRDFIQGLTSQFFGAGVPFQVPVQVRFEAGMVNEQAIAGSPKQGLGNHDIGHGETRARQMGLVPQSTFQNGRCPLEVYPGDRHFGGQALFGRVQCRMPTNLPQGLIQFGHAKQQPLVV